MRPSKASVEWWFRSRGLVGETERLSSHDLAWAIKVLDALRATLHRDEERSVTDAQDVLERAAGRAGLRVCFGCGRDDRFHTEAPGLPGAVGRLLGIAFLAQLSGEWDRLRECSSPTCTSVFFDRSKNRSARWCSMQTCGNRNKVRNFRERARASTA
jgi:predicted RNA-binding Zn ribbon-like protein